MAFSIHLMRNNSPKEKLDKDLTILSTVNGNLKTSTSIISPVIMIEGNLSNFTDCNYMYIPEFDRFYFVNDITSVNSDVIEFSCHVDVLTTYRDQIRRNHAIVKRQENSWNLYLNDGSFKVYQNPMVLTRAFPSGFSSQEFVLAVAGS